MISIRKDRQHAEESAEKLKSLGHPIRLQILAILNNEDARVGAIAEELAENQAIISQQMRILRMSGLVEVIRENGNIVKYRLAEDRVRTLLECLEKSPWR